MGVGQQNGTAGMHNHSRYWRRHGKSSRWESKALCNGSHWDITHLNFGVDVALSRSLLRGRLTSLFGLSTALYKGGLTSFFK